MFSYIAGKSVGAQFLDEAKKLLDLENGRASLPTVQGLTLMFTLSAYRGMDRAGMVRTQVKLSDSAVLIAFAT
jgi:hypothetical protein